MSNTFLRESASPHLDAPTKTPSVYLFCDVDGVLRARDPKNSRYGNAYDFDPSVHYDMNVSADLFNEKRTFDYSTEMIQEFRSMIANGDVEFVWVTNWLGSANRKLSPLFGFGERRYLEFTHDRSNPTQSYKGEAVEAFLREHPEAQGRSFVWLDDVATHHYLPGGTHDGRFDSFGVEYRIFAPEERHGLSRAQMAELKQFVNWVTASQADRA